MIDTAITPDGTLILMARAEPSDDVAVRLRSGCLEILSAEGRVLASLRAVQEIVSASLRRMRVADVVLAGSGGLACYTRVAVNEA